MAFSQRGNKLKIPTISQSTNIGPIEMRKRCIKSKWLPFGVLAALWGCAPVVV